MSRPRTVAARVVRAGRIMVNERPDTAGGVLLVNVSRMDSAKFREVVDKLRDMPPSWFSSRGAETFLGWAETG